MEEVVIMGKVKIENLPKRMSFSKGKMKDVWGGAVFCRNGIPMRNGISVKNGIPLRNGIPTSNCLSLGDSTSNYLLLTSSSPDTQEDD